MNQPIDTPALDLTSSQRKDRQIDALLADMTRADPRWSMTAGEINRFYGEQPKRQLRKERSH